jgi:hypothetical protein
MDDEKKAFYHEKDCPTCQRLSQNCCLSPLTESPLPFSGKLLLRCPYYARKEKPPQRQLTLWG